MTTIATPSIQVTRTFVGPIGPATGTVPAEVALAEQETALLAKAAAETHERLGLRGHPELRHPERQPVDSEHLQMLVQRFSDSTVDGEKINEASFDRHIVTLRAMTQTEEDQSAVPPSDTRFATMVQMMRVWFENSRMEREMRSAATKLSIESTVRAGEQRVTAAEAAFATAIAGGLAQAGIGAIAVGQTVKSVKITSNSVKQNVGHANSVDVTTRTNQQAANIGTNKAAMRPERTVQTTDGQQVKLPSDRAAETPAMRSVAESQPLASEVPLANADHTLAQAKAQIPYMTGSVINMMAPTINGVVNGAGHVAEAEHNRLADLQVATAELHRQISNERNEQVNQNVHLHEAALSMLQALNSQSSQTTNQIIGNM